MFNFLKKKKTEEGKEEIKEEAKEEDKPIQASPPASGGELIKLTTDLDRIKASVEAFTEVRKSFQERFTRISEQIGELRSMILERDKSIQEIELKAIKAYDLVASVQPEKIMTQVQRQEAKLEALKANLEGNESIMDRVMEELKETKQKIQFFRGVEEIVKLSEEVKRELIEIKRVESKIAVNTDKVETIYSELRKRFQDLDQFDSKFNEIKVNVEQNLKDVGFLKDKVMGLAEKAELERLVSKVQRYIDALKELQKKSALAKDIEKIKTIVESLK